MKGSVYERQTERILTGGWSVLPPGDLVGESEALQCENFRVTTAGNLRSRQGNGSLIYNTGSVRNFCVVKGSSTRRYSATHLGGLWRNGSNIGSFGLGAKIGMASYQGYLWAMSNGLQQKDDGTTLLPWNSAAPANPTVTALAGGGFGFVLGAVYTYWITYTNAAGQESPSNAQGQSIILSAGNAIVSISSPSNPGDGIRTGWNVYRTGNTLQGALRLNTSPLGFGSPKIDTADPGDRLDDFSLTQLGIALDPNASGPPAGNGLAGPYYEKLLAWGVAAHPNRLYWSGTLQPYNFPGSALDEGNHVDIGELGEGIVGVTIRPRMATIYKDSSIWRLVGDPNDIDGDLELVTRAIGAISPPLSVGGMDYFEGAEGLYGYNGERPSKITGKLDPLFRGETPEDAGFAFSPVAPLEQDPQARALNALGHRNGRLYFFYAATGASFPNRGITCELGADNWAADSRQITAILEESQNGLLLASISSGGGAAVYQMEKGELDAGAGIVCSYHSGYKDQGAPDQAKTYADIVIEHNTGDADVVVSAYYDNGAHSEALGTIHSTTKTTTTLQLNVSGSGPFTGDRLGFKGKNIAIRIEGTTIGNPILIYKAILHYFPESRDAKTFDSDETDLGTQQVKAFKELELDIDYPAAGGGTITWRIFTDRPGGAMASRDSNMIAATSGRVILRIPFSVPIDGRLVRVTLRCDTAGSTFRLYGVRLRALPYGEYIDNVSGEVFTTEPVNVGMR